MKIFVVVFAIVIACAYASPKFDAELDEAWELFKKEFNKKYETLEHEVHRRKIFEENVKYINNHNSEADLGKHTFRVKINQFGDMHNEEFKKMVKGVNVNLRKNIRASKRIYHVSPVNAKIPDSIDWRTQGFVTPVKNQEQCGSCWAFSATCALEGQHFKQTGKLVSLSEQNLVDCSSAQGNAGCNGGLMDQAFQYIITNKGIDTEDSYPYKGVDGKCRFNKTNVGATMLKFVDIQSGSEADLQTALATVGPIAAAMDASLSSFQFYSSGLYYDPQCTDQINHGINPVGYGSFGSGQDYYIAKNMWGTSWGDKGYVYMARNKNNNCGIATAASYPVV